MAFDKVPPQSIINSEILISQPIITKTTNFFYNYIAIISCAILKRMLECNEICQELKHYSYIDFAKYKSFIKFDC